MFLLFQWIQLVENQIKFQSVKHVHDFQILPKETILKKNSITFSCELRSFGWRSGPFFNCVWRRPALLQSWPLFILHCNVVL